MTRSFYGILSRSPDISSGIYSPLLRYHGLDKTGIYWAGIFMVILFLKALTNNTSIAIEITYGKQNTHEDSN
jgi:hypothetical protein